MENKEDIVLLWWKPKDLATRLAMTCLFKVPMVHYVLPTAGHDGGLKSFPYHCIVVIPSIGVEMFIALEGSSRSSEYNRRMFITLE